MNSISNKKGFTLIELLVVIAIIGILAGMMLASFSRIMEKSKIAKVKAEAKSIEVAFKQSYEQYRTWPSNATLQTATEMDDNMAIMLSGNTGGSYANYNRKRLTFIEFSRLDPASGKPVNIWGQPYYVKFDSYNNSIAAGSGSEPPSSPIATSVIVWSINPNKAVTDPKYYIKSWE